MLGVRVRVKWFLHQGVKKGKQPVSYFVDIGCGAEFTECSGVKRMAGTESTTAGWG